MNVVLLRPVTEGSTCAICGAPVEGVVPSKFVREGFFHEECLRRENTRTHREHRIAIGTMIGSGVVGAAVALAVYPPWSVPTFADASTGSRVAASIFVAIVGVWLGVPLGFVLFRGILTGIGLRAADRFDAKGKGQGAE